MAEADRQLEKTLAVLMICNPTRTIIDMVRAAYAVLGMDPPSIILTGWTAPLLYDAQIDPEAAGQALQHAGLMLAKATPIGQPAGLRLLCSVAQSMDEDYQHAFEKHELRGMIARQDPREKHTNPEWETKYRHYCG